MDHCYKTLVSLGNSKQYFTRLIDLVRSNLPLLPQPLLIQTGHTPCPLDVCLDPHVCHAVDFLAMDEFIRLMHASEVLIGHAGAGFIMHAIKAKKHPIVMPRRACFNEVVNDHQLFFAQQLNTANRVTLIENPEDLPLALNSLTVKNVDYLSIKNHAQGILENKLKEILNQAITPRPF